jgi:hypothetical protein
MPGRLTLCSRARAAAATAEPSQLQAANPSASIAQTKRRTGKTKGRNLSQETRIQRMKKMMI